MSREAAPEPPAEGSGLDPRLLLTFREVARSGSISAAARKLGWTQPALGQQLRRLEREAGTALVQRHARGISLTPAGEVLLGHADAIAGRLLVAQAALRDSVRRRASRLVVATFPSGASSLVAPAAARLVGLAQDLDLRVLELEPPAALEALQEGQVDMAVAFEHHEDPETLDTGQLRRRVLGRDDLLVALPASHPLAARPDEPLSARELTGTAWISGCLWCQTNLKAFGDHNGFVPDIRFTSEDQVVVQEFVASGLGVALISKMTWHTYRRSGVVVRPLHERPHRTISVLSHQHDPRRVLSAMAAEMRLAGRAAGLTQD